jgi:hypothetical protein
MISTLAAEAHTVYLPDPGHVETGIVERTNALRQQNDRKPLRVNPRLAQAARDFAASMSRTGRFGHGADGNTLIQRAERVDYAACTLAENIAFQYSSVGFSPDALTDAFMQGWWDSPGHRRNLLAPEFAHVGVGVVYSPASGHWHAVQIFAKPLALSRSFSLHNAADVEVSYHLGDNRFSLPPRMTRTHQDCKGGELRLRWSDGESTGFTPENGSSLQIERGADGRLRLRDGSH